MNKRYLLNKNNTICLSSGLISPIAEEQALIAVPQTGLKNCTTALQWSEGANLANDFIMT